MTNSHPPAGWIGVCPTGGAGGKLIEIGEWLNGEGFKDWEHAFVSIGSGLLVQAEPGGAQVARVTDHPVVHWCENIAALATPAQLAAIANAAKHYVGTPYSPEDYFALALHRFRIPAPGLRAYIASSHHMICSQLADQCYADAGVRIFTDNRWPGYVTPLSLYNRDLQLGGMK